MYNATPARRVIPAKAGTDIHVLPIFLPKNFSTTHNNLDAGDVLLCAGIAASKNNWSLFATYTAHIAGNWTTQTGEAGVRIKF